MTGNEPISKAITAQRYVKIYTLLLMTTATEIVLHSTNTKTIKKSTKCVKSHPVNNKIKVKN